MNHGPWKLLENVILAHLLANFRDNSESMTTEHILQGFNEIITFSKMPHCSAQIPDYIMYPSHKNLLQMSGKLQSLLLENEGQKE